MVPILSSLIVSTVGMGMIDIDGGLPQLLLQSEGEGGGDKLEQVELWGRMEERWLGQEFLGLFQLLESVFGGVHLPRVATSPY